MNRSRSLLLHGCPFCYRTSSLVLLPFDARAADHRQKTVGWRHSLLNNHLAYCQYEKKLYNAIIQVRI